MKRTDWKFLVDSLLFVTLGGVVLIGRRYDFSIQDVRDYVADRLEKGPSFGP